MKFKFTNLWVLVVWLLESVLMVQLLLTKKYGLNLNLKGYLASGSLVNHGTKDCCLKDGKKFQLTQNIFVPTYGEWLKAGFDTYSPIALFWINKLAPQSIVGPSNTHFFNPYKMVVRFLIISMIKTIMLLTLYLKKNLSHTRMNESIKRFKSLYI